MCHTDKINGLLQENMRPLVYYTIVFWVHKCTIGPTFAWFDGEMGCIALPFLGYIYVYICMFYNKYNTNTNNWCSGFK